MRFTILESKQDELKLIDAVGEDLAKQFLNNRKKYPSPYNDIYYWIKQNDPMELVSYMANFNSIRDKKDEGIELIYQDDDWKVFRVLTYNASKKYGANTRWCISGTRTYKSGKSGEEYFNQYKDFGVPIIFFISPKYGKYALCVMGGHFCQIFNEHDDTVGEIPNLPDAPEIQTFKDMEPITLTRVYEDDEWAVDHLDNQDFSRFACVVRVGDEEDAYRYDIISNQYMTPSYQFITPSEFKQIDDEHRRIADILETGGLFNEFITNRHS